MWSQGIAYILPLYQVLSVAFNTFLCQWSKIKVYVNMLTQCYIFKEWKQIGQFSWWDFPDAELL